MTSREIVLDALNYKQPKRIPMEFGATATTGMHVTCVAALRDYYGLEKRPVKIHEPYQLLGWIDEDLAEIIGIDIDGIYPRCTLFGFPNENWKPWRLNNGLEVQVSEHFKTTLDENGDTLIYPQGDEPQQPVFLKLRETFTNVVMDSFFTRRILASDANVLT